MRKSADRPVVELAFEHAQSGKCKSFSDVCEQLKKSGVVNIDIEMHLSGKQIRKQLKELCQSATADSSDC